MSTTAVVGAASTNSYFAWVIPWMPVIVGVVVLILTRLIMDMNASKKREWNYNTAVMCLCAIVTGVFVHEWHLTASQATLFGMGAGAAGVSIIGFGKPLLLVVLAKAQDGLKTK
jgi:hypothetical protein